ncbi:MAG: Hpt domain-containing protein [Pseudobacteriovorax sp.]|nr:Hpt domain-containing protein [Pseudobacteriovorax sp.]
MGTKNSAMRTFNQITDFFLPERLRTQDNSERAAFRLFVRMSFALLLVCIVNGIQYKGYGMSINAAIVSSFGVIIVANLFLLRNLGNYLLSARIFLICGTVVVVSRFYITGGFESPVIVWAVSIPLVATWLTGKKEGFLYALTVAVGLILVLRGESLGLNLAIEPFPEAVVAKTQIVQLIACSFIFLFIAFQFIRKSEDLMEQVIEANRSVNEIVENVQSGFLIINHLGEVQKGHSRICDEFIGKDIDGKKIETLLFTEPKDQDHFALIYQQVFDDILPESASLSLFPPYIQTERYHLRLKAVALRNEETDQVSGLLLTFNNADRYIAAERARKSQESLIKILMHKESFKTFLRNFLTEMEHAHEALGSNEQTKIRNIVHTIKGNSSVFGLDGLVDRIHIIENAAEINKDQLTEISELMSDFLKDNRTILGIYEDEVNRFETKISQNDIDQLMDLSEPLKEPRFVQHIDQWVVNATSKSSHDLLRNYEPFVENLAERLHKKADLKISGDQVMVDAKTWAAVDIHLPTLIRNALYHGIENEMERGDKPESGFIEISVKDQGHQLEVTMVDDGQGLNIERIKEKALQLKLISPEKLEQLPEQTVMQYIFQDSLSTESQANDIAGRGMGLSAVKENLQALGGSIEVFSTRGQGCRLLITIPWQSTRLTDTSHLKLTA